MNIEKEIKDNEGLIGKVLKDIHFSLAQGSFHFMKGESGAGKTSLLGLLYLDHLPTKGRVRLFGQTVDSLSRSAKAMMRRQIGVVFQDYRLLEHLTAFDNVALPLRLIGEKESLRIVGQSIPIYARTEYGKKFLEMRLLVIFLEPN